MKRVAVLFALIAFVAVVWPAPARSSADSGPLVWPAILGRADVNGDGAVSVGDIMQVVLRFGTTVEKDAGGGYLPGPGYMTLYDVDGGGAVSVGDIMKVVLDFGLPSPLIDQQVAQATLAATGEYGGPDLRDPAQALAAGWVQDSQDVPSMGVHMDNPGLLAAWPDCCSLGKPGEAGESQLIHPVGLVYTEAPGGGPEHFIGTWYLVPTPDVCAFYGLPGPCQSEAVQPVGFGPTNEDEDNEIPPGAQQGWHTHPNLCGWGWGTTDALALENVSQEQCEGGGGAWFPTYGWMLHLYNFVPNPDGRFMLWNTNVP